MKPGPVTKLDKKNKTTSNKIDDEVMSTISDVTAISPIYGAIPRSHSECIVCKT